MYYELADLCTLGIFSGLQLNELATMEKLGQQIQATTDLAVRFMEAAEALITAVVTADGWELREL